MTQDEIIRMAREAGFQIVDGKLHLYFDGDKLILKPHYIATVVDGLKNFAEIVEQNYIDSVYDLQKENIYTAKHIEAAVLAEREACAKVCEEIAVKEWDAYKGRTEPIDRDKLYNPHIEGISDGADECAAAIRARGTKYAD